MIRYFIVVLALFFSFAVFGQQETFRDVPGLLKRLAEATTDTARILIKCRLGEAYRDNKPDSSVFLATEALSHSTHLKFKKGEIQALLVLSVIQREKGDLPNALELGLRALKIAEEEGLAYDQVYATVRVAVVYGAVRDFQKQIVYLKKAENLLRTNYDDFQWLVVQYFLGDVYEKINDLDAAEKQVQMIEQTSVKYPSWLIINKRLRANIAVKKDQLPLAVEFYRESYLIAMAQLAFREAATTSNALAVVFKRLGQIDSAIFYAKQGLKLGEMLAFKNRILAASSLLAELYAEKDPKESLRYLQMATAIKDSLYGVQKVLQLQSSTIKEQERQAEQEAARVAYQNKIKQWALIGGISIFLIVALILYRNNRQKQKANKVLEKTLTDLRTTQSQLVQAEKMASLGELTAGIAHEIQNPLNFVNNFSEVNEELIRELDTEAVKGNLEEIRAIAKDIAFNSEKINHHGKRADAIVKGMLQHSRTGSGVKEPTDINALADEYLRLAYHGLRAKDNSFNATTKTDFDNNVGKIKVVPQEIGRVILNLISNAFYAVCEKRKENLPGYDPAVIVSTGTVKPPAGGGLRVEIKVKDNGNGIPERVLDKIFQPFFTTKPTGEGTGLGLSMSYDIVKAHGGELKVQTKEGEGSEFIISLPS